MPRASEPRHGHVDLRERAVQLLRPHRHAEGHFLRGQAGASHRHRGTDRRRQEHAGQLDAAFLRSRRTGRILLDGIGHSRSDPQVAAPADQHRPAGAAAVFRHHRREHPLRPAGGAREEIIEAAKAANAHDFIMRLPQKYDTLLGERGAQISGGERQRISVARAFLKNAPILILDEPTSSVDSKTEAVILEALDRLMMGRTTFMIAHRLSTLHHADLILVLNDGRLVEQGTQEELLRQTAASTSNCTTRRWRTRRKQARRSRAREMRKEKIVLLGFLSHFPVAGVAWQTIHYLVGFQRLGYEVYYVEAHGCTPSKLMRSDTDDGPVRAAAYIGKPHAPVRSRRPLGLSRPLRIALLRSEREPAQELYRRAALIINLHGSHLPTPELPPRTGWSIWAPTRWTSRSISSTKSRRRSTISSPIAPSSPSARTSAGPSAWCPSRNRSSSFPPASPWSWISGRDQGAGDGGVFTTIGNWRQPWRQVQFRGEIYRWSKHYRVPQIHRSAQPGRAAIELALSSASATITSADCLRKQRLARPPRPRFLQDLDPLPRLHRRVARRVHRRQRPECAAAQRLVQRPRRDLSGGGPAGHHPGNRVQRHFADRRRLVRVLDDGRHRGGRRSDQRDYERHRRAAHDIAREYFSHEVVLTRLLQDLGIHSTRKKSPAPAESTLPADIVLAPTSRWPTRLSPNTVKTALSLPIPVAKRALPASADRASIAIVTYNGLPYTKMCLSSLLGDGWDASDELIIVDNHSTDGTQDYLRELKRVNPFIQVQMNDTNRGFAAANNQALALATGDILIFLNNDTIVTPGWRNGLARWLEQVEIGMVGPVTNRTCNEAQIDAPYRTYAELEEFAERYTQSHAGQGTETQMLAMFCLAIRRDTLARIGPLDERFEVGMFEDDDYSRRVRQAGYKIICAEDVFVHHFGQAALGELCVNDEYDRVFESNRRRFESKWNIEWQPHGRRITPEYEHLRKSIRQVVAEQLPGGATILVISKGDEELLKLTGQQGWHFPRDDDGRYPHIYPADSTEAITQLELARAKGAGFLVIPKPAFWWLEYYSGFKEHLEGEYALSVHDEERCLIFDLAGKERLKPGDPDANHRHQRCAREQAIQRRQCMEPPQLDSGI